MTICRVKKGDVLVRLDREPYLVQLEIKKAAVAAAETDLLSAQAQVRGLAAQTRTNRFKLEHAIENVNNQVANLRAVAATLNSRKANLELAQENLKRGELLAPKGTLSKEEFDLRKEAVKVATAGVEQTLQQAYAIRVGLGLPAVAPDKKELTEVPADLDQTFSSVRQAVAELMQSATQIGYFPETWNATPKELVAAFYKQDPKGNLDRIFESLFATAPIVKQADAKLLQTRRDLEQAELNLRYCDVLTEIDGVVTRRNVNPGNNVQAGQSLMAVRSLTEIWIDANFKETQLADLRIGQRVDARSRHVRQPPRIRRPHHRLHDGHRLDAGAAAAAKRDGQLRQDRAAAAGADRADRLRSGRRCRCSSASRSCRTSISRSRRPAPMPASCSAVAMAAAAPPASPTQPSSAERRP